MTVFWQQSEDNWNTKVSDSDANSFLCKHYSREWGSQCKKKERNNARSVNLWSKVQRKICRKGYWGLCLKFLTKSLVLSLRADGNFETFDNAFLPLECSSNFLPILFILWNRRIEKNFQGAKKYLSSFFRKLAQLDSRLWHQPLYLFLKDGNVPFVYFRK